MDNVVTDTGGKSFRIFRPDFDRPPISVCASAREIGLRPASKPGLYWVTFTLPDRLS